MIPLILLGSNTQMVSESDEKESIFMYIYVSAKKDTLTQWKLA